MSRGWSEDEDSFLRENYPIRGKVWCMDALDKTEVQVRCRASQLGLRLDHSSEFCMEWQKRAAMSKVGKKRPEQALVVQRTRAEGKLTKTPAQREAQGIRMKAWIAEHEHPRGALGMKHSAATKEKMSAASKKMWRNMSEAERDKRSKQAAINAHNFCYKNREGASWKAGWREFGGKRKYYRSRWEANYGRYLQWLKERGEILEWDHEPETFWFEGIKRGVMSYLPDFRVVEKDGRIEYHEVKGWMDSRSKTTIKRMAKYHPDVKLIVIDGPQYRALVRTVAPFIREWES